MSFLTAGNVCSMKELKDKRKALHRSGCMSRMLFLSTRVFLLSCFCVIVIVMDCFVVGFVMVMV